MAESLPEIDPLPDNPDHQTMVKKLAEIEARAKYLLLHGKKLTNKKDRAFFLAEMKKRFDSYKELRRDLKNFRGNSISNMFDIAILRQEIVIINELLGFLKNASEEAKVTAVRNIFAAEEAEAAKEAAEYGASAKKHGEAAAAAFAEAKKIEEMTVEEFKQYYLNEKKKEKNKKLE